MPLSFSLSTNVQNIKHNKYFYETRKCIFSSFWNLLNICFSTTIMYLNKQIYILWYCQETCWVHSLFQTLVCKIAHGKSVNIGRKTNPKFCVEYSSIPFIPRSGTFFLRNECLYLYLHFPLEILIRSASCFHFITSSYTYQAFCIFLSPFLSNGLSFPWGKK